jgi:hypothetical protein
MFKRLTITIAALAIGLLPLTAAMANELEEPTTPPALDEIVAAAVADYLEGLELSPEVAAEVGQALGDLVQTLADAAAAEAAADEEQEEEEVVPIGDEEGEEDGEVVLIVEDEEEVDDEAHGEMVSMVAQCAPRGKLLKGTGVNHGTFVSAVAGGNPVVVPAVVEGEVDVEGGEEFTVETVEDAEALCEALEAFAADLEAAQAADVEDAGDAPAAKSAKADKGNGNKGKGAKKDR